MSATVLLSSAHGQPEFRPGLVHVALFGEPVTFALAGLSVPADSVQLSWQRKPAKSAAEFDGFGFLPDAPGQYAWTVTAPGLPPVRCEVMAFPRNVLKLAAVRSLEPYRALQVIRGITNVKLGQVVGALEGDQIPSHFGLYGVDARAYGAPNCAGVSSG